MTEQIELPIGPASPKQELLVKRFQEGVQIILAGGAMGCLPADTEFLSDRGWVAIKDYKEGLKVAEYIPEQDKIEFKIPKAYIKLPCDSFNSLRSSAISMTLSDEHTVLYKPEDGSGFKTMTFCDIVFAHNNSKTVGWTGSLRTAFTGILNQKGLDISEGELRLQVVVMEYGSLIKHGSNNSAQILLTDEEKYKRLIALCKKFSLPYKDNGIKSVSSSTTGRSFEVIVFPKWMDKRYLPKYYECSYEQLGVIADEIFHWNPRTQDFKTSATLTYHSNSKANVDFIQYTFSSLGMSTTISYESTENGKQYKVFTQKDGDGLRSFLEEGGKCPLVEVPSVDGFKYCFNTSSGYFVVREGGNIFMTGNSGKSYLLQLLTTLRVDDPKTHVYMTRETLGQLEGSGGLVDTCKGIYEKLSEYYDYKIGRMNNYPRLKFLNGKNRTTGATITFAPMRHEQDVENWRGLQLTLIGIDEAHKYSESQINMIISRLRSESSYPSQLVMTCNPDPDWYWCEHIKDYYLDEEGFPIQERAGDVRYFYRINGEYLWANSKEELISTYNILGDLESQGVENAKEVINDMILSFTFIPMNVYDNPPLIKSNPSYLANLLQMSPVEKARNLWGNWFLRPEGSGVFQRSWVRGENGERVKRLIDIPENCTSMRGVDKAYQTPSDINTSPDYTALSPLMLKDREGFYWLVGNYHPKIRDEAQFLKSDKLYLGRFRRLAGERDNLIALQMKSDQANVETFKYKTPKLVMSKDNAAGGTDYLSTVSRMIEEGIEVVRDNSPSNTENKKLIDFLNFTKAAQLGLVFIVEESFDPASLEGYWKELEGFDGAKKSGKIRKDDWVDATSICFNAISAAKRVYSTPVVGTLSTQTISAKYLRQVN